MAKRVAIIVAKEAYEIAGIRDPLQALDEAEIYNPFTSQELLYYECFGCCDRGKAVELVGKGLVERGGNLPCAPSGGFLCTNPIGATSLQRVADAALPVAEKTGNHQIHGAKTALAHAMGGMGQLNGLTIIASNP